MGEWFATITKKDIEVLIWGYYWVAIDYRLLRVGCCYLFIDSAGKERLNGIDCYLTSEIMWTLRMGERKTYNLNLADGNRKGVVKIEADLLEKGPNV